jgi:hypothetical protein
MFEEALLEAKVEWQGLKDAEQIREDSTVEIREVMNSKTPKVEGKTSEQAYIHGVKAKDKEKRDCTKNSKTWVQVINNSSHMEKETHSQGNDMQSR